MNSFLASASYFRGSEKHVEARTKQSRSLRQSLLHICVVSALILLVIPYQVVFLICFLIHWVTCWRSNTETTQVQSGDAKKLDALNQNIHILMLLLWLLPNMAPSLAVWIRTMATAGSISLFNDDHWPHLVIPYLMIVEFANARSPFPAFLPSRSR